MFEFGKSSKKRSGGNDNAKLVKLLNELDGVAQRDLYDGGGEGDTVFAYDPEFYDPDFADGVTSVGAAKFLGNTLLRPLPGLKSRTPLRMNMQKFKVMERASQLNPSTTVLAPTSNQRKELQHNIESDAQFDINVSRVNSAGVGVAGNLPFALFSPVFLDSDYNPFLENATGFTRTIDYNKALNRVTFAYSDGGGNTTQVNVTSSTTPYTAMLRALMYDKMTIVKTRISISDISVLNQLTIPLKPLNGSMFGGQSRNNISTSAAKSPFQQQDGIVDIDDVYPLDKYRGMTSEIAGGGGFVVTYSLWAKYVERG